MSNALFPAVFVCPTQPPVHERDLLGLVDAKRLEALFKSLANTTRLRLFHALVRAGELCVTDLADSIGMKPQAVSNQLQRLTNKGILGSRRNGTQVYYRVEDPFVVTLLDQGLCLTACAEMRTR